MSRPDRLNEAQAAKALKISKSTLARERMAGRIRPIRIGPRIIHYTQEILDEYEQRCRNAPDKLESTGSASDAGRTSGAARGTTPKLDRQSASLLAQQTFSKAS